MGQLPADLRASCSAYADTAATCRLTDGTYVLYQLFGTDLEARKDVVNGNEPEPKAARRPPLPPGARSSAVMRSAQRRAWPRSVIQCFRPDGSTRSAGFPTPIPGCAA